MHEEMPGFGPVGRKMVGQRNWKRPPQVVEDRKKQFRNSRFDPLTSNSTKALHSNVNQIRLSNVVVSEMHIVSDVPPR
jgi:hypothetical protein